MKADIFTTYGQGSRKERLHQIVAMSDDPGIENRVINLYPKIQYEGVTLEGFGGAVTDAAGYVYSQMDQTQKKELLSTYFSEERMNYSLIRVPLDSCDFSLGPYEAMSDSNDAALDTFSLSGMEKYVFPMLRDIQSAAKKPIPLMLSPWSPPAFMKTNGRRDQGGKLLPQYRAMWAEYLCRYILEFQKRGYPVRRISLQNEPNAAQSWDSCVYTASEEKAFLRDHMVPAMRSHGLSDIEVFIWDHNKERVYEWMRDIVDSETEPMVAGAAFHWYSGDHFEALDLCRRAYPNMKLILSESCIEFSKFDPAESVTAAIQVGHELIGDLNHGVAAFYDWNLLLDEKGGPNYAGNYCLAPFRFDTHQKELRPHLLQPYIEHFSHYMLPGSVRFAHTKFTDSIDVTSWRRPDGQIVVILLNKDKENQPVCLRIEGKAAEFILHSESITTVTMQ